EVARAVGDGGDRGAVERDGGAAEGRLAAGGQLAIDVAADGGGVGGEREAARRGRLVGLHRQAAAEDLREVSALRSGGLVGADRQAVEGEAAVGGGGLRAGLP